MKKKFEYKTHTINKSFWSGSVNAEEIEVDLNELGEEGWELISVIEENTTKANEIIFLFKREI